MRLGGPGIQVLRSYRSWAKEAPVQHVIKDATSVFSERFFSIEQKHEALLRTSRSTPDAPQRH